MTRKHFEAIAKIFHTQITNPTVPAEARQALYANANMQADYFVTVNPLFDRAKFLTACGMGGKVQS